MAHPILNCCAIIRVYPTGSNFADAIWQLLRKSKRSRRERWFVHLLVRAGSVEAEAAFAGLLVALDHILLASVANVARRARAPVPIPEGGAGCAVFTRLLGTVILQLAVRP